MSDHLNLEFPELVAGTTYEIEIPVVDDDGVAVDVSDYTVWLTLKLSLDQTDAEAALQYTMTAPDNADSVAGNITMKIPPSLTLDVSPGSYYADVQVQNLASDVYTVAAGVIQVRQRVTQSITAESPVSGGIIILETYTYTNFSVEAA